MLNACQQDAGDHGLAFGTLRLDNNSFGSNFNLPGNQSFIDYLNDDSVDLDWINSLPESDVFFDSNFSGDSLGANSGIEELSASASGFGLENYGSGDTMGQVNARPIYSMHPESMPPSTPNDGTMNAAFSSQRPNTQNPSLPPDLLNSLAPLPPQTLNLNSGQLSFNSGSPDGADRLSGTNIGAETRCGSSGDHHNRRTTWSSRNQHLPLNYNRSNLNRPTPDAEKGTMKARQADLKAKRSELETDINEILEKHAKDIDDLAKKHSRTSEYINKIVTNRTCYKNPRKVSLHNAIIHHKNEEINGGRMLGERMPLSDIQRLAKEDPQFLNMSEERKKELLDALMEHRKVSQQGLRASNVAASLDITATMDRMGHEMDKLSMRTGVRAFAVVAKGHSDDSSTPGFLSSGDVLGFFPAVLKMSGDDFLSKFEQWSIMQDRRPPPVDSLKAVRAECTALIMDGLCVATGRLGGSIKMNYLNYDISIVQALHVKLVGWPDDIPFGNPSTIPDVGSVRRLRNALKEGTCRWDKLTERQQREHDEWLQEKRRAGQVVGVKRKGRSDKGGSHKKWGRQRRRSDVGNGRQHEEDQDDDEEHDEENNAEEDVVQRPRRSGRSKAKSAKSQIPPAFKSKEFIDDGEFSGDDNDGDYDDGDGSGN